MRRRPYTPEQLTLTPREIQVAQLVGDGYGNNEIAEIMGISVGTVKRFLSMAFNKTGCNSRLQLGLKLIGSAQDAESLRQRLQNDESKQLLKLQKELAEVKETLALCQKRIRILTGEPL